MVLLLCLCLGLKEHIHKVFLAVYNWLHSQEVDTQIEENFVTEVNEASRRHEIQENNDVAIEQNVNDEMEPEPDVETSPQHTAGSSSVNEESDLDDNEWARWQQTKTSVQEEPSQQFWMRRLAKAKDFRNKEIAIHTRTMIVNEDFTNSRIRRFKEAHQLDSTIQVTDEEIARWHRLFNRCLRFVYDAGQHVVLKRKERDESDYVENLVTRLSWNEVHDKICQTPLTFDPTLGQNRFVEARPHEHGAFEFHNEFYLEIHNFSLVTMKLAFTECISCLDTFHVPFAEQHHSDASFRVK